MDCHCGDPSCGYCQAAREMHTDFYNFDEFVPMDPYNMTLQTIFEEDETRDDVEGDEENQNDPDQDVENTNQLGKTVDGMSFNQINQLQFMIMIRFVSLSADSTTLNAFSHPEMMSPMRDQHLEIRDKKTKYKMIWVFIILLNHLLFEFLEKKGSLRRILRFDEKKEDVRLSY
ncbi:hypothetical protein B9Z55_019648 [Caenorhabditis nigoni]|uniref:Uncharacterized protein n=1 Tax=Caenorhabditis nigoni TaxID=1611254 RepID=A0A2G5TJ99_9PELO|nr:hypothetical protein B9Z55_019648 [Caenorhabditis nigoni]